VKLSFLETRRAFDDEPPRELAHAVVIGGPSFDGFEGFERQLGGIWIEPTPSVLGLPAFDDADEGREPSLYACFEVEKILRMLLRQSPLALRTWASPIRSSRWDDDFLLGVIERALSQTMVHFMLELSSDASRRAERASAMQKTWANDSLRWALSAHALSRGTIGFELTQLASWADCNLDVEAPVGERLQEAQTWRERVDAQENVLPAGPADYNGLSDWLVELRRETI